MKNLGKDRSVTENSNIFSGLQNYGFADGKTKTFG